MRKAREPVTFYLILAVIAWTLAMIFCAGCDSAPPREVPDRPGLRACPLCGKGLEWAGRYYWCSHCNGPIL